MHSPQHAIGPVGYGRHIFDIAGTGSAAQTAPRPLIVLSLLEASSEACASALEGLSEFASGRTVIALASTNDAGLARAAIRYGAKGYIPVTMGFEIAIEVMRFVLAGGTYVPIDCVLARQDPHWRRELSRRCAPVVKSPSFERFSKANRTKSSPTN